MGWWNNPDPPKPHPEPPRRRAPLVGEYSDIPASVLSGWDVPSIKSALDSHELGQFQQSALLAEAMTRDDRIHATLNTRVLALLGCELSFELPKRVNKAKAKAARRLVADFWPEMATEEATSSMLRWSTLMGFSIAEIIWETSESTWMPRLKVWHPQFTYFNLITRKYVVLTGQGPVEVTPGDGKWIVYAPQGLYRGWMSGSVRAVSIPWIGRTLSFRDWLRYNEVHGMPFRKAITPAGADPAATEAFWNSVVNLGNEPVFECPTGMGMDGKLGYDIQLVEPANQNSWEAFKEFRADCDKAIAIEHLGQNLTTEATSSGLSRGDAQSEVRQDYLEADEKTFGACLQAQLLRPFCLYNSGDERLAPLPKRDVEPPKDVAGETAARATAATTLTALATLSVPVDVRRFCEDVGIPLLPPVDGEPPLVLSAPFDSVEAPAVTKNEARARRRLPAITEDGPLVAPQAPGAMPFDAVPEVATTTLARPALPRKGAIAGQLYADRIADAHRDKAAEAMRGDLAKLSQLIESAASFDELRASLATFYADMDPTKLAEIVEHALVLADLTGRHSFREDHA
jgi:phage gp29-like protein